LALAGIVIAIWFQSKELSSQTEQFIEQADLKKAAAGTANSCG